MNLSYECGRWGLIKENILTSVCRLEPREHSGHNDFYIAVATSSHGRLCLLAACISGLLSMHGVLAEPFRCRL